MVQRIWMCFSLFGQLLWVIVQMVVGTWRVTAMPKPIVTIFGGSRFAQKDPYFHQAHSLAQQFVDKGVSVLTGGGSGIMQAVSCGAAYHAKDKIVTMGIGVRELGEGKNNCVQKYFEVEHFFARQWLLTRFSAGFVIFPGGFGTLDELAEVLELIKSKKMPRVPIILVGVEYWQPLFDWITNETLQHGLIEEQDMQLFKLTDDLQEVIEILCYKQPIYEQPTAKGKL